MNKKNYGTQNLSWNANYKYTFTSIKKPESLAKTETFNAGTSELIPQNKCLKNSNITFVMSHIKH